MTDLYNKIFFLANITNSSEELYHLDGIRLPKNISDTKNLSSFSNKISAPTDIPLTTLLPLSISLGLLIISTIIGNVLVMTAICRERNLQSVGNYLIFSLSCTDLLVACLVMPLAALNQIMDYRWILSAELCEAWTVVDILCCSASILHLVAIALERYWAVTNIEYAHQRSGKRIGIMIFLVWIVAFVVSFAPIMGWKDDMFHHRIEVEKSCSVSHDSGYQVFSTCSVFYVPLVAILVLYWRIYQVARDRIRRKPGHATLPGVGETSFNGSALRSEATNPKPRTREAMRERKAAKILSIVTGVFCVCWLPFFIILQLMLFCPSCEPDPIVYSLSHWLAYGNSALNPLIYTVFSPDFRKAFTRQLCCKKCSKTETLR